MAYSASPSASLAVSSAASSVASVASVSSAGCSGSVMISSRDDEGPASTEVRAQWCYSRECDTDQRSDQLAAGGKFEHLVEAVPALSVAADGHGGDATAGCPFADARGRDAEAVLRLGGGDGAAVVRCDHSCGDLCREVPHMPGSNAPTVETESRECLRL